MQKLNVDFYDFFNDSCLNVGKRKNVHHPKGISFFVNENNERARKKKKQEGGKKNTRSKKKERERKERDKEKRGRKK